MIFIVVFTLIVSPSIHAATLEGLQEEIDQIENVIEEMGKDIKEIKQAFGTRLMCGEGYGGPNCQEIPSVTKVLVTTGSYDENRTEIVSLNNMDSSCTNQENFPLALTEAVGSLVDKPVICGGYIVSENSVSDKCYSFVPGGWTNFANMAEKRSGAAAVSHKGTLHIFGGFDSSGNWLKSTEMVTIGQDTTRGKDMPQPLAGHAISKINGTFSLITGGLTSTYVTVSTTWFYNHDDEEFTRGPNLLQPRFWHASGILQDHADGKNIVAIIGGRDNKNDGLKSTELLIDGGWQTGPDLPIKVWKHTIVEFQNNLILLGGWNDGERKDNKELFQLECHKRICKWTKLQQEIEIGRFRRPVAMLVPDSFCASN